MSRTPPVVLRSNAFTLEHVVLFTHSTTFNMGWHPPNINKKAKHGSKRPLKHRQLKQKMKAEKPRVIPIVNAGVSSSRQRALAKRARHQARDEERAREEAAAALGPTAAATAPQGKKAKKLAVSANVRASDIAMLVEE